MPSSSRTLTYAAVLRTPSSTRLFSAALLGRLSYGTVFLSLILAVTAATGSYAVAGAVMSLFGLTVSVLSPVRAGLIDRYGPRRALPPMAMAYAALLLSLGAVTWRPGASHVLLGVLAVAAGACAPPLGPVERSAAGPEAVAARPQPGHRRRGTALRHRTACWRACWRVSPHPPRASSSVPDSW